METKLKTGDILHCSSNRMISKLIRKFTKSKFSHSALFIDIEGTSYIIDAQKDGVNLRLFSKWKDIYKYDFVVHRSQTLFNEDIIKNRALSKSGTTAYDFEGLLIKQPVELATGKWRKEKCEECQMYCSEFVAWVWKADLSYRMSPQDLFEWCVKHNFTEVK